MTHGACEVAAKGDLGAGKVVLRRVVDVDAGDIEGPGRFKVIDIGLDAVGVAAPVEIEVLRHKLVGAGVCADETALPRQVVGHQAALEFGKCCSEAGVDGAVYGGKVGPVIDAIAPVVESKFFVHRVQIGMLLPQSTAQTQPARSGRWCRRTSSRCRAGSRSPTGDPSHGRPARRSPLAQRRESAGLVMSMFWRRAVVAGPSGVIARTSGCSRASHVGTA